MIEYKVIKDTLPGCQKLLNQWRHQYNLEVLFFISFSHGAIMLVAREEKE